MPFKNTKNVFMAFYQLLRLVWLRAKRHQVSLRAAHLTLASLLAAVPIITIVFGILRLTPAINSIQSTMMAFIESHLAPGSSSTLIPYLLDFSEQTKNLPAAGVATLILTALLLLNSFEGSVQSIWKIKKKRKIRERLLTYWAVLTLGPIMLAVMISLYGTVLSSQITGQYIPHIFESLVEIASYLIYFLLLLLINFLIPNTEVKLKPTAISALVGGIAIGILNSVFANFAQFFASYQIVYGTFAALPIFLIWLQFTWLIILLSTSLNATLHNLNRYKGDDELK